MSNRYGKYFVVGALSGMFIAAILSVIMPNHFISLFGQNINCGVTAQAGYGCGATYQGIMMILGLFFGGSLGLIISFIRSQFE